MKKYILIFLLILSTASFGEKFYAIGGNFGTNTGLNFLVYSSIEEAIQINTSFDLNQNVTNFTFTLDKVYFDYMDENSSMYYGIGLKLSDEDNENVGIRGVIGVSGYLVDIDENLEAFAELDPTIHLAPDNDFLDFEFGLGFRYYF